MKYRFAFYTGYGIHGISAYTIKPYYIGVNADNDGQAIIKLKKKSNSLIKFNEAFRHDKCGVEINTPINKVGCCFIKDSVIKWEGGTVLKSPQVYGLEPYKLTIQPTKYIFDGEWVLRNVWNSIYPSYTSWFNYVWVRMNGNRSHYPLNETDRENELNKYYYKPLKEMLKSDKYNEKEKLEFETLLNKPL